MATFSQTSSNLHFHDLHITTCNTEGNLQPISNLE